MTPSAGYPGFIALLYTCIIGLLNKSRLVLLNCANASWSEIKALLITNCFVKLGILQRIQRVDLKIGKLMVSGSYFIICRFLQICSETQIRKTMIGVTWYDKNYTVNDRTDTFFLRFEKYIHKVARQLRHMDTVIRWKRI